MIAISGAIRRTILAKGGTTIEYSTAGTCNICDPVGETTNETWVVVVADNGWREVTVDDLATIEIKEPAQEQDESDTGESPVYVARQHRRLATVNRAGRTNYPRKAASSWG